MFDGTDGGGVGIPRLFRLSEIPDILDGLEEFYDYRSDVDNGMYSRDCRDHDPDGAQASKDAWLTMELTARLKRHATLFPYCPLCAAQLLKEVEVTKTHTVLLGAPAVAKGRASVG
jgi:hypothetical protein